MVIPSRGPLGLALAALFAAVLGMESTTWARQGDRLMAQVRAYPSALVPLTAPQFDWVYYSPLAHWTRGNYVAFMQGKQPAHILLDPEELKEFEENPRRWEHFLSWPQTPPGPAGWFDFRPALRQIDADRANQKTR